MTYETETLSGIRATASAESARGFGEGMTVWGTLLLIAGLIAMIGSFAYDVSVDVDYTSSVANLDKISIREMILSCGGFVSVSGTVLFAAGKICSGLVSLQTSAKNS